MPSFRFLVNIMFSNEIYIEELFLTPGGCLIVKVIKFKFTADKPENHLVNSFKTIKCSYRQMSFMQIKTLFHDSCMFTTQ